MSKAGAGAETDRGELGLETSGVRSKWVVLRPGGRECHRDPVWCEDFR